MFFSGNSLRRGSLPKGMDDIVPQGSSVLPISADEFVRHGSATNAPQLVVDLWLKVGAFVVPERDPGRRDIGDVYRLLDPYTVAEMQDPSSSLFLRPSNGYPLVHYGTWTVFCVDDRGDVRFSYDDHVISTDVHDFLGNLASDLGFVEKLVDEGRLRDDPDARLRRDVRRIVSEAMEEVHPTSIRDMGRMMKAIIGKVRAGEDLSRFREIAEEELNLLDGHQAEARRALNVNRPS
jgi:hypothetical protein